MRLVKVAATQMRCTDSIEENIKDIKPYMIVNCTPIGMKGYGYRFDINKRVIAGNVEILYDLVYNPYITDFLAFGKSCGCKIISGIDMLLLQAFASIKIWTGKEIDFIYGKNILQQEGIIKNM
jgi:shikimate dehydrogenase